MPALRLNRASGHSGRQRFGSLIQYREVQEATQSSIVIEKRMDGFELYMCKASFDERRQLWFLDMEKLLEGIEALAERSAAARGMAVQTLTDLRHGQVLAQPVEKCPRYH